MSDLRLARRVLKHHRQAALTKNPGLAGEIEQIVAETLREVELLDDGEAEIAIQTGCERLLAHALAVRA
jgi:hypothetical protein